MNNNFKWELLDYIYIFYLYNDYDLFIFLIDEKFDYYININIYIIII